MVYQANQHAIWHSPILKYSIRGRQWLETYVNLFALEVKTGTGTYYQSLHVVEEFPDYHQIER